MAFHSKTEACRPDMSKKASSSAHNCAWSAWNTKNSTCPPRSTRLGESTAACPALGTSPPEPSVAHTSYRVCGPAGWELTQAAGCHAALPASELGKLYLLQRLLKHSVWFLGLLYLV